MTISFCTTNTLVETVAEFHKKGGKHLFLDEVHKYPGWAKEIKNLFDFYPDLQIVFTGSSIIDISREEGDLSRRARMYELQGLSYREYLKFTKVSKQIRLHCKQSFQTLPRGGINFRAISDRFNILMHIFRMDITLFSLKTPKGCPIVFNN